MKAVSGGVDVDVSTGKATSQFLCPSYLVNYDVRSEHKQPTSLICKQL